MGLRCCLIDKASCQLPFPPHHVLCGVVSCPTLTAACGVGSGTGRSKKEAEQSAARSAPEQLKKREKRTCPHGTV